MKAKQTDFIKIDKHADPLENFFKNFFNQAKTRRIQDSMRLPSICLIKY